MQSPGQQRSGSARNPVTVHLSNGQLSRLPIPFCNCSFFVSVLGYLAYGETALYGECSPTLHAPAGTCLCTAAQQDSRV